MFSTKFAVSFALLAPLASALSITTPTNWTNADPAVIEWTAVAGDPQTFSIELQNPSFNRQFALANNVETGAMSLSLTLPVVPVGDGYVLQFVNIGNISDVFAETGDFSIGESLSTSTSSSSTTSSSGSASATSLTVSTTGSSSHFGTTVSASSTGATTGTSSSGSSSSTATGTNFNSGAQALGFSSGAVSFAVMIVAAIAGAQFVGL